ncbi:MAG: outer membrane lipoprotein carrier protein LolA [Bacteroidales bacterium]|nr:outer membrane lipoprotein carrier protein LolA [Deltaproteobacteria bacterium]MBL7137479.1 outer membrane lipoprotein carrier protein LolA [Bacteroidales bacterium]
MKQFLGIILATCCMTVFAQKDDKAATLLEEVSNKTKTYSSIKADFTYSMDNKEARIHESKTGNLLVSGEKYKVNVAGQEVFCNGEKVWTYIGESNEVQINEMDTRKDAITPTNILTSYHTNYKSRIIQDKDAADPNLEAIELIPYTQGNYEKVIVIIDKKMKQIKSFKIFDRNGNIFTYKVTRFQTNVPVKDADFIFHEEDYDNVEVIDMR